MTREYVFQVWAPPGGPWSDWAKPVLFAHVDPLGTIADLEVARYQLNWIPPADGSVAVILDLRGELGVSCAASLAVKGFRPVPLYNAMPGPARLAGVELAMCNVWPIIAMMSAITPDLDKLNIPYGAPPVFVLDAERRVGCGITPQPGIFDNRSVSLPTDFPSANYMLSRRVRTVILVQQERGEPEADLCHTLLRWQQAGIEMRAVGVAETDSVTIHVRRPPLFRRAWQALAATIGLKRSPLGGFGGVLPYPSSGGGG